MLTRWQLALSLSLGMTLPTLSQALTVGNIEVKSAVNEPFKARVPIRNVNVPINLIKTQMASHDDYARLGIDAARAPNLQFRIQDSGNGNAILWLSSDEPVRADQVDLLIRVGANEDVTLHQMSAALNKPSGDIGFTPLSVNSVNEIPLIPTKSAPPPMAAANQVSLPKVTSTRNIPEAVIVQPSVSNEITTSGVSVDPIEASTLQASSPSSQLEASSLNNSADVVVKSQSEGSLENEVAQAFENRIVEKSRTSAQENVENDSQATQSEPNQAVNQERQSYTVVVGRDTLWGIAKRVSKKHGIPMNQVMLSIQALNQDAFIRNNPNLLRAGKTLTIPRYDEVNEIANNFSESKVGKRSQQMLRGFNSPSSNKPRKQAANVSAVRKSQPAKAPKKTTPKVTVRKSVKKTEQAEMRIVAPTRQGNAQGEVDNSLQSAGVDSRLPPQIVSQVKKSRIATIQQRKRVNDLNKKLSSFRKKIELRNARLAELESRLKQLNDKAKQ